MNLFLLLNVASILMWHLEIKPFLSSTAVRHFFFVKWGQGKAWPKYCGMGSGVWIIGAGRLSSRNAKLVWRINNRYFVRTSDTLSQPAEGILWAQYRIGLKTDKSGECNGFHLAVSWGYANNNNNNNSFLRNEWMRASSPMRYSHLLQSARWA